MEEKLYTLESKLADFKEEKRLMHVRMVKAMMGKESKQIQRKINNRIDDLTNAIYTLNEVIRKFKVKLSQNH